MVSWADLVFWPWAGGVLASMGGLSGPLRAGRRRPQKLTVRADSRKGVRCSKTVIPRNLSKAAPQGAGSDRRRLAGGAEPFRGADGLIGNPRQALGFAQHREHVEDPRRG